jgi:FtsP/CotA-like multicopper oxidase with cupredoxin domain
MTQRARSKKHSWTGSASAAVAALVLGMTPVAALGDMPTNMPNTVNRDPANLPALRKTSVAERVGAAQRAEQRRAENEAKGLVAPRPKPALQAPKPAAPPAKTNTGASNAAPGAVSTLLAGVATAVRELVLAQAVAPDLYASPNYATSKWPIAHCAGPGANTAQLCQKDSDCAGYLPPFLIGPDLYPSGATCTGPVVAGTGLQKFKDTLPGLCNIGTPGIGANNLGNCIPLAVPDTTTFPGSDYYEIGLKDYTTRFHSDLVNPTKVRGYYQKNVAPTDPAGQAAYLGPLILAHTNTPVRLNFTNELATSAAGGNLFIPMDNTLAGTGLGPDGLPYSQNRATIHLHGGNTPWISDGTQHQWTAPAAEPTTHGKGLAVGYVPDMWFDAAGLPIPSCNGKQTCAVAGATNNPGAGKLTFYYTNQQSGRLMFYHDHAYGITRLNVYAGEAAGYLLVNAADEDRLAAASVPGTLGAAPDLNHVVPLIIQDKTFVPPAFQLSQTDPTWDSAAWTGEDGLWLPHVYTPNQWPDNPDLSNTNPFGRWDYGPWFWPVQTSLSTVDQNGLVTNRALTVPCTSVAAVSATNPTGATVCPSTPLPSLVPEAFLDTPVINGTAYPTVTVDPVAYRFQVLNAANERNFNLSLFVADPLNPTEVVLVPAVTHTSTSVPPICDSTAPLSAVTGTPNGPDLATPTCWPQQWPTDSRQGGVPDPATAGPKWLQIGTEGGLLPIPATVPPRPVVYEQNKRNIVVLNVASKSLFMGPAERADVVVDFSAYAGKTLILYNDAPAPVPAGDPRQDYYTGGPDFTTVGGAPTPLPGYGPNTRTVMQIVVRGTAITPTPAVNEPALASALAASFVASQPKPLVPESAYNPVYAPSVPYADTYLPIQAMNLTFTPVGATAPMTINFGNKALHELFTTTYGRMDSLLGVEIPNTNWLNQTTIPFSNFDPPTEYLPDGAPQMWKITHNGVDTHTIHFHLFNVQVVNRVGWDGQIRPPDANELGWKDSVRMNPLEDIIVALVPVKQSLPWPLPDMVRMLDVDRAAGTSSQFTGVDIFNVPIQVVNKPFNFGQEYVWHCHLLGHEEEDMLRTEILVVPPETPTNLLATMIKSTSYRLDWANPSKSAQGFTLQRDTTPLFNSANLKVVNVLVPAVQPGPVTYTDSTLKNNTTYFFRVQAAKSLSSPADAATVYNAPSGWSNVVQVGNAPKITATPASLLFATQALNTTSAAQVVTIRNTGTATLGITSIAVTGVNATAFTRTTTCGKNLAVNATCTVSVTFRPTVAGPNTAAITIVNTDPGAPSFAVPLAGTGAGPSAMIAPTALTFASQALNTVSAPQTVTVSNVGTTALTLGAPVLGGTNSSQFAVVNGCGASLAAAASCTISVTFAPTAAAGGTLTASLTVGTNDPAHASLVTSLTGTGIAAATGVTLAPDQASPHANGLPVTFTAKASGPSSIPLSAYQYQFTVNGVLAQTWSATATYKLLSLTGTYSVQVDVRTSPSTLVPDASATVSNYVIALPAVASVTMAPSLPSPHTMVVGQPVVFTATALPYGMMYQFWLDSGAGYGTTPVQAWSVSNTWSMPATTAAGTYNVMVEVTNSATLLPEASVVVPYVVQ